MDWDPFRPNRREIEAVGIDPENNNLVIIKIPLNKNPRLEWECFFENPKEVKGPIHSEKVRGDQVLVRVNRDSPIEAVEQIFKYIEFLNIWSQQLKDLNSF